MLPRLQWQASLVTEVLVRHVRARVCRLIVADSSFLRRSSTCRTLISSRFQHARVSFFRTWAGATSVASLVSSFAKIACRTRAGGQGQRVPETGIAVGPTEATACGLDAQGFDSSQLGLLRSSALAMLGAPSFSSTDVWPILLGFCHTPSDHRMRPQPMCTPLRRPARPGRSSARPTRRRYAERSLSLASCRPGIRSSWRRKPRADHGRVFRLHAATLAS